MEKENKFSLREKEIFETLKKIKDCEFVLIGGYAVTSYTLPRFSVDCDIVLKNTDELEEISKRYNFNERFSKLKDKIESKQFKDGLQGVFGLIDNQLFERHKKNILDIESS
jgi:hypothetical protein